MVFFMSEKVMLKDLVFLCIEEFFYEKKKIFNLLKIDSFKSLLKFVLMLFLKIINFVDFMDYVCVLK